ncbi:glycosyltransferase [Arcicella rosea]|uniref:Glycosyltransferase involved in cell wall biosynthesis n=1 Tax=Arcicella rosea TaxID=502909 RepID=A0A841EJU9_9BACT|nr:glycosyltransferase [Arcicella rosea]MBB6004457.1 glycosyltransferase involved in cell wall biosynthesis [Arcicella rosea]
MENPEKQPIVTVIAICYNHSAFLLESLTSVVHQTYQAIQLIVVDDASEDDSQQKLLAFMQDYPSVQWIFNEKNIGNCKSFNQALLLAKGKYIIDLSTDDVLEKTRIEKQVRYFESLSNSYGVVFSNAIFIDEQGKTLSTLYDKNQSIPEGNIYSKLIEQSFILPSTMMIKNEVLDSLNGYDETLSYEDFDFWIRSSRNWEYAYLPEILTFQRKVSTSLSSRFVQKENPLVVSTVKVCAKILSLNRNETENKVLIKRLHLVLKQCVFTEDFEAGEEVIKMLIELKGHTFKSKLLSVIIQKRIPLNFIYLKYNQFRA